MIEVRAHNRRKPAKPPVYIAKHEALRADVAAMKRGELAEYRRPISATARVLYWLRDAVLLGRA